MAGVAQVEAKMSVRGPTGVDGPFDVVYSVAVTKWTGKRHMTLATGITDQSLIDIGGGGITTIKEFMLVSDQAISIKFGAAGSNAPIAVVANAPCLLSGVTLTAISLSNASGNLANIDYMISGD